MSVSLSHKLVARYGAALILLSVGVRALLQPVPMPGRMGDGALALVATAGAAIALFCWFAPWDRWPQRNLYAIAMLMIALKSLSNTLGGWGSYSYAVHYTIISVWIGFALPRGAMLRLLPVLTAAYCLPIWWHAKPTAELLSVAMTVPLCVIAGESVAWMTSRLRQVEASEARNVQDMQRLVEATTRLGQPTSEGSRVEEEIVELCCSALEADAASLWLRAPDRTLELTARWGTHFEAAPPRLDVSAHPGLVRAMQERTVIDEAASERASLAAHLGLASLLILPLASPEGCRGVVLVASLQSQQALHEYGHYVARAFAAQAAFALDRVVSTAKLVDAALTDELTGLGNRRDARMRLEVLKGGDALVMIDLDHFKHINDTHGHAVGDEVLRQLSTILRNSLRESDEVYRWGGEEFLVVLAGRGADSAAAAGRLRERWAASNPMTTFSAGVAVHEDGSDWEHTLARADEALYAAKAAGRNRVELAD